MRESVAASTSVAKPRLGPTHALLAAYLLGVAGTLWDWREHFLGVSSQAPHVVIDAGGLLAIGVLAFTGWAKISRAEITGFYVLLALVALITLSPFVLMMSAPHSRLMAVFMQFGMTRSALGLYLPIVLLAGWAAWHWLGLAPVGAWRLAAALGVVVVAIASIWDLYWHQTHPLEMGASMNMMALPPHQLILAGFLLGAIGALAGVLLSGRQSHSRASPSV
jgi:hypothetical protein